MFGSVEAAPEYVSFALGEMMQEEMIDDLAKQLVVEVLEAIEHPQDPAETVPWTVGQIARFTARRMIDLAQQEQDFMADICGPDVPPRGEKKPRLSLIKGSKALSLTHISLG